MKDHYISYEQAKRLRALGFRWKVDHYYTYWYESDDPEDDAMTATLHRSGLHDHNGIFNNPIYEDGIHYSAPRLDQAQAWLREVKNVIVCPFPERYKEYVVQGIYRERLSGWDYEIWVDEEEYSEPKFGYIESYEKALELGIDKALELLGKEDKQ